jgi:hypothetical protein
LLALALLQQLEVHLESFLLQTYLRYHQLPLSTKSLTTLEEIPIIREKHNVTTFTSQVPSPMPSILYLDLTTNSIRNWSSTTASTPKRARRVRKITKGLHRSIQYT